LPEKQFQADERKIIMSKIVNIVALLTMAASLVGCNDGHDFTAKSRVSFDQVENVLNTYETRKGEHYVGIGGAMMHELEFHARSYRQDRWYPIGDHYSVMFQATAEGLSFNVARDH
jgi:hypothetical protein